MSGIDILALEPKFFLKGDRLLLIAHTNNIKSEEFRLCLHLKSLYIRCLLKLLPTITPFAEYLGYQEAADGFIICYEGTNGQQYIAIDTEGNVLGDTTLGTTRTIGAFAAGAAIFNSFLGGSSS
ncbi:MAG: hypothetical protein F6K23_01560 [Okeania sp. SIO2C9]|uniref:hypothetical protein n=1 Tax=Okeania sp. SIO2C9 TaxID=2607791 RepID=UPI0013C082D4|nr:hypothetical protein [Okeania sp. SIO2C9]NEQ71880.1 hypothetical protein [Okeania sp. SIO2C9]